MSQQATGGLSQHLITCCLPDQHARRIFSPPVQGKVASQVVQQSTTYEQYVSPSQGRREPVKNDAYKCLFAGVVLYNEAQARDWAYMFDLSRSFRRSKMDPRETITSH